MLVSESMYAPVRGVDLAQSLFAIVVQATAIQ
jgi:hypothetical protein